MSDNNIIRTIVRGVYDLQKLRIQMGNRVVANFKSKLGQEPGTSEKELEQQEKKLLKLLRESYNRITDAVIDSGEVGEGKMPTPKKFKGDELISTYTELVLVDEYLSILKNEETHFNRLEKILRDVPIYNEFLSKVDGVGPAMAGVIVSEIDIQKAQYPSSLWKLSGLDAVTIGVYTDGNGKEQRLPMWRIEELFADRDIGETVYIDGKYPVSFTTAGRSRRDYCLENKEYIDREGNSAVRRSLTYNPFLKTKLMGVLATSFLRSGSSVIVNGKKMGAAKRLELAKAEGFKASDDDEDVGELVISYLKGRGFTIIVERSKYATAYYDYKQRLQNHPNHKDKTDIHKHYMSLRFAVKRFLVDLHMAWRTIEGLPVSTEYSEGKLGMIHKQA